MRRLAMAPRKPPPRPPPTRAKSPKPADDDGESTSALSPEQVQLALNNPSLPFRAVQEHAPPSDHAWVGLTAEQIHHQASPPESGPSYSAPAPLPVAPAERRGQLLQLLWFDPEAVDRIRLHGEWAPIIDRLADVPADRELEASLPAKDRSPATIEARRDVAAVLSSGQPALRNELTGMVAAAVRPDGSFLPPLTLLEGDLAPGFDAVALLETTCDTAVALAPDDETILGATSAARGLLGSTAVQNPAVALEATRRVQLAFGEVQRSLPKDYLLREAERVVLAKRAYDSRKLFGAAYLCCALHLQDGSGAIPTYLSESVGAKLPLFRAIRARILVEVHPRQDEAATHSLALRVVALAWLAPRPSGFS